MFNILRVLNVIYIHAAYVMHLLRIRTKGFSPLQWGPMLHVDEKCIIQSLQSHVARLVLKRSEYGISLERRVGWVGRWVGGKLGKTARPRGIKSDGEW